jgi:hypothetical protein
MDNKHCKVCGELKPLDDFYRHDACKDGHRPECKACNLAEKARRHAADPEPARERTRAWREVPENRERTKANQARYRDDGRKAISNRRSHLKRKYGITLEDYEAKLVEQGGVCGICGREPRPDISLHVDHDHGSGALRGLLCFRCNQAIGSLGEDPYLLDAAAAYLRDHDPETVRVRDVVLARIEGLKRPA